MKESKDVIQKLENKIKTLQEQDTSEASESQKVVNEIMEIQEKYRSERLKNHKLTEKVCTIILIVHFNFYSKEI